MAGGKRETRHPSHFAGRIDPVSLVGGLSLQSRPLKSHTSDSYYAQISFLLTKFPSDVSISHMLVAEVYADSLIEFCDT